MNALRKDFGNCPGCGAKIDGHDYAGEFDGGMHDGNDGRAPLPGDALICEYCASVLVVNPDGNTVTEMKSLEQLIDAIGAQGAYTVKELALRAYAMIRQRSAREN